MQRTARSADRTRSSRGSSLLVAFAVLAVGVVASQASFALAQSPDTSEAPVAAPPAEAAVFEPAADVSVPEPAPAPTAPVVADDAVGTDTSVINEEPVTPDTVPAVEDASAQSSDVDSAAPTGSAFTGGVAPPVPSADQGPAQVQAAAPVEVELGFVSPRRAASIVTRAITGGTVDQCSDIGSIGISTITCTVTVTNNFTYNPATPNQPTGIATIVTEILCTGSATCPTGGTTTQTTPITIVTQCNNAGSGGAGTVTCTVTVTNNLTGYPTGAAIDSTVLQCQSPGAVTTETCVATPSGNDRPGTAGPGGQGVTQCNDSGGPGGTLTCTVTAPPSQDTGLPTQIEQCVSSGQTGASTVTCTATIVNNFLSSTPPGDGGDDGDDDGDVGTDGGGDGETGGGNHKDGTGGGDGSGGDGVGGAIDTPASGTNGGGGTGGGDDTGRTGGGTGRGDNPALPFTGIDLRVLAVLGTLMLLIGVLIRPRSRRLGERGIETLLDLGEAARGRLA